MDAVEEIKSRLSVEDVISEYVQLKRVGQNWRGLSPFTNERSPSFMVSPEKQIWHDFSSGKGGNIFTFIMEMEGLDFKEALELLAKKAGVDLSEYRGSRSKSYSQLRDRLYLLLDMATKFYQLQLKHNNEALSYLIKTRRLTKDTILDWQIGYAPNQQMALINFLKKKQFSDDEIKRSGLSVFRYGRFSDMFRNRIMIPLKDEQGRVIGFTARLFDNGSGPKYINSPQTILYDKSKHVFGLDLAKESIRKSGFVVVAEGNLDVIMSRQAGVTQVVATAGTAMTENHLKLLGRYTHDVRLSFDADAAGTSATERAIPIASKVGISLSVVTIPVGKDPDELIKKDATQWEKIIMTPEYAVDWLINRYKAVFDIDSGRGKREFTDVILKVITGLSDPVEKEHYILKLAEIVSVNKEALEAKLGTQGTTTKTSLKSKKVIVNTDTQTMEYYKTQDHLLSLILLQPKLRDILLDLEKGVLLGSSAPKLFEFMKTHDGYAGDPLVTPELREVHEYVKILLLQYETLYKSLDILELRYEAMRLKTRLIEYYVKDQKSKISLLLENADETETRKLLEKVKKLDTILKSKGGING